MTSTDSEPFGKNISKPGLQFSSRPTSEEFYNVNFPKKGRVAIFNHHEYKKYQNLGKRTGTDKDLLRLKETFASLEFEVADFTDLSTKQIRDTLRDFASKDYSDFSCLVIVMMTHGDKNGILFTNDTSIYVNDLWSPFTGEKCPTLAGKPKLFFIQACKGGMVDPGAILEEPRVFSRHLNSFASRNEPVNAAPFVIPTIADILVYFSTAEGYYSYRSAEHGSWFIQILCDKFSEYLKSTEEVDLMRILTAVNRHVAYDRQVSSTDERHDGCKQMPTITSMLTKVLIFNRNIQ